MPNRDEFQSVRKEHQVGSLNEADLPLNPIDLFRQWYKDVLVAGTVEPNAFALATCFENRPSVRYVLLKDISFKGFSFYTNYNSKKGQDLSNNPYRSGTFYWKELERQVRFEGSARKLEKELSDEYFSSRPRQAQLGVHASNQSNIIPNRQFLEDQYQTVERNFKNLEIPRPDHWGGYLIEPSIIEFWQGRVGRLHDRIRYSSIGGKWEIVRLSP